MFRDGGTFRPTRAREYRDNNFYALLLNGIAIVACDCRVVNCYYFLADCISEMIYELNNFFFFFFTLNKFSLSYVTFVSLS